MAKNLESARQLLGRLRHRLATMRRKAGERAPTRASHLFEMGTDAGDGPRVIGVLNYKGGTGKTTTVVNLATGLAMQGARVLCVDLDAQGAVATFLDVEYTHTITDLLLDRAAPQACIVNARENLDLVPCDRRLIDAESALWQMGDSARYRLAERMRAVRGYDYVVLDYSPSAGIVGECGLLYNREVIVPVAMNYMALVGTRQVIDTLKGVAETHGHHVALTLIVPTFYDDRQRLDREVMELLQKHFGDRVADPIRTNVKLSEAPSHGRTIYEYDPRSPGAVDYLSLVERVARRDE